MPALSYKDRFVELIEAGLQKPRPKRRIKTWTIRNPRKNPIKVGDTLYHYFAQRSKWCRKLGESICKAVHKIRIGLHSVTIYNIDVPGIGLCKHVRLTESVSLYTRASDKKVFLECFGLGELNKFAYADGFDDWADMKRWWKANHGEDCFPFTGQLIKW